MSMAPTGSTTARQWVEQERDNGERGDRRREEEPDDNHHNTDDSATTGLLSQRENREKRDNMQRPGFWERAFGWIPASRQRTEERVLRGGTQRMLLLDEIPSKSQQRRRGCFVFGLAVLVIL